jgi:DNA-binding transcriptional ArsR family regulator
MRPPKHPQDPLTAPLNWILGSEAAVRLLRELFAAPEPLSRRELAVRTGLSVPGTHAALERLGKSGIVEVDGAGGGQRLRLRTAHPLHGALRLLFASEALRHEALLDELSEMFRSLPEPVTSAWVLEPEPGAAPDAPLGVGLLAGAAVLPDVREAVRERLRPIEARFDVTILVQGFTRADLETAGAAELRALANAVPVHGPPPAPIVEPYRSSLLRERGGTRTHREAELRAAAAGQWLADRLDADPSLPRRARNWIVHRMHLASSGERHELDEWLRLLDGASISRIKYLLLSQSEAATRLRQSNPFVSALTEEERVELNTALGR